MNINLHIERLVLDGLPIDHGQGGLIKEAVEAELGRLLREGGVGQELRLGGAFASQRTNPISLSGEDSPSLLGQQIGRAVYTCIGGGSEIKKD